MLLVAFLDGHIAYTIPRTIQHYFLNTSKKEFSEINSRLNCYSSVYLDVECHLKRLSDLGNNNYWWFPLFASEKARFRVQMSTPKKLRAQPNTKIYR